MPLFPCKGKYPVIAGWQDKASKDPKQIAKWAEKFGEDVKFGVPTGVRSGLFVVDIDDKNGKEGSRNLAESWKDVVWTQDIDTPQAEALTFMQKTPSGGRHYFFKYHEDRPLRNGTDIFGTNTGVDIRGEGGYVLIAPSEGYEFTGTALSKVIEAPDEVYDFLAARNAKNKSGEVKLLEQDDIKGVLDGLDPEDDEFATRDGWQQIMRAVNSASGGADWGKQLFIDWSLRHPGPWDKDVSMEIERDWPSYDPCGSTTAGTLMFWARKKDVTLAGKIEKTMDVDSSIKTEAHLQKSEGGLQRPKTNVFNVMEILSHDILSKQENLLKNLFVFNDLSKEVCFFRKPPWRSNVKIGQAISDTDVTDFRSYLASIYKIDFTKDTMIDGISAFSMRNRNHPVKNYLDGLVWDEKERLSTWLCDACGTPKDTYHMAISRKLLLTAVARIYRPGVHMDNMVVLEGEQGCRKSSLVRVLGHHDREGAGWYSAPAIDLKNLGSSTSAITDCMGSWIIEMEEMASVNKADESSVKKFLSTREDRCTLKYDKFAKSFKRQYIFVGTINPYGAGKYIRDKTGARRYWPIAVKKTETNPIDVEAVDAILDQLYAEAVVAFKSGEKLYLEGAEQRAAMVEQEARVMGSAEMEEIREFFNGGPGTSLARIHTRKVIKAIWPGEPFKQYRYDDLTQYMKNIGAIKKKSLRVDGKVASGFIILKAAEHEIE
jgi:predicted P-loop ATPase